MADDRFETGLAVRKEVLGADYVDRSLATAPEFAQSFQRLLTEYCWGEVWGDDTLDRRTRSLLNVVMLAALNRMHEWELHFRGALTNGVTRDELKAAINQIAVYCGVPVGVECHRIARRVFEDLDAKP